MMTAVNERLGIGVIFRPRCKCWDCPDCAKTNADLWQTRAEYGADLLQKAGQELVLVTVTAHERHKVSRAVECLPSQWNKLRSRWQRATHKPQYILVPEVGKKGHFHIHFLTTGALGTRWWKDNARESGFGYSNDESERGISAAKTAFYVGKYLAKQLNNNVWKKGLHRVRTSQGWPKVPPFNRFTDGTFYPLSDGQTIRSVTLSLAAQGYSVALADSRASWTVLETGKLTDGATWLTMSLPNTEQEKANDNG